MYQSVLCYSVEIHVRPGRISSGVDLHMPTLNNPLDSNLFGG